MKNIRRFSICMCRFLAIVLLFTSSAGAGLIGPRDYSGTRGLEGLTSPNNGPNCFNFTLRFLGYVGGLRHSVEGEFKTFLDSSLCKEIPEAIQIKAGDVGRVQSSVDGKTWEDVHAFVYLDPNQVFQKSGYGFKTKYESLAPDESIAVFDRIINEDCKKNDSSGIGGNCLKRLQVMRCKPWHNVLHLVFATLPELKEVLIEIALFEEILEQRLFRRLPISNEQKKTFLSTVTKLGTYLQSPDFNLRSKTIRNEVRDLIFGALYYRLESIKEQISAIQSSPESDKLRDIDMNGLGLGRDEDISDCCFINDIAFIYQKTGIIGLLFEPYLNANQWQAEATSMRPFVRDPKILRRLDESIKSKR